MVGVEPPALSKSEKINQYKKEVLERLEKESKDRQRERELRMVEEEVERVRVERREKALKERAYKIAEENMAKEEEAERRAKETEEKRQSEVQTQLELKRARNDALEAEKARKAGDERRRLAEDLPDYVTVSLHDIVRDVKNPRYREARRLFKLTNIRGLMISFEEWYKTFFQSCEMKSDFVIAQLYALVDIQPRQRQFDEFQTMIFENLSRCFEYKLIAPKRREWMFIYNKERLDFDYTNRGSTAAVWKPTQNPLSEFWRLVGLLQDQSLDYYARRGLHETLEFILKSSSLTNFQKVSWSHGILTVICALLSEGFPSEYSHSCRLKNEVLLQENSCQVEEILKILVFASKIFSEACSNKSDLRSLIEYDGILVVKNMVVKVLSHFTVMAHYSDIIENFKPNSEPRSIYCEYMRDLFVELRGFLATKYKITEQQLAQLELEASLVRDLISDNRDLYLDKKDIIDREQAFRIRSIKKWFISIKKDTGGEMDTIIQDAYHNFALKLSELDTRTSGDDENFIDENDEVVIVAEYDSQGNEINGNTEVNVPIQIEKKLLSKTARDKRKPEEELEILLPSKLPKYDVTFVDKVWKSIERTFGDLSGRERQQIFLYDKFGRGHKRGAFRFHMLLSVESTIKPNALPVKKRLSFVPFRVEEEDGPRLEAENNVLAQFECQSLSEEAFNTMKWHVMCNGGRSKVALEFFTELTKLKNVKSFKKSVSNGTLDFKFKVYKHLWFMGSTLPCQLSPDSHEDTYNVCAGCTKGDVILVHNCTCEFHNDPHNKTTIYAHSNRPVGLYMVTRLVGRFVCEHGPSSVLQLDSEPPTAEKFIRRAAKYVQFPAKLRVLNMKTMFDELCKTFTNSQTSSGNNIGMVLDTSSERSDESTGSNSLANTDEEMSQDNESSSWEDAQ